MFRTRLFTVMVVAGLLGLASAGFVRCGSGGTGMPPPSTTTTTMPAPGTIGVAPSHAVAGTVVSIQASGCSSVAGYIPVFLVTTEDPSTRLSETDGFPENGAPGNWSVELTIPQSVAPGSDYLIEAQCWGDGFNQG